jgi:hypothetical protein
MIITKLKNLINRINNDVFVYEMGKVGSTSVVNALRDAGLKSQDFVSFKHKEAYSISRKESFFVTWVNYFLLRIKKRTIITIVREPISRNISEFFQALHIAIYEEISVDDKAHMTLDDLLKRTFEKYIRYDHADHWFKNELEFFFDVDVFKEKFHGNHAIIENSRCRLLILRMEDLSNSNDIISKFVGRKISVTRTGNIGENKWYAEMYKKFKGDITPAYVKKVCATKTMCHFYSSAEISKANKR